MIEISLGRDFQRFMDALNRFSDFRQKVRTSALRRLARIHKQQIRERLLTKKRGPDGEAWPAWSEATRKRRQAKGNAGQGLLVDNRKLVNSFQFVPSAGKGQLGSPLPYANAQHYGYNKTNLPARPYAGVGRADERQLERALNDWVKENHPFK